MRWMVFLGAMIGVWMMIMLLYGCAEINIYVVDGASATVTIEQDRTVTTSNADVPMSLIP